MALFKRCMLHACMIQYVQKLCNRFNKINKINKKINYLVFRALTSLSHLKIFNLGSVYIGSSTTEICYYQ